MSKFVTRFLKDESGATAIEYGLIVALIAVVIATIVTTLGGSLKAAFTKADDHGQTPPTRPAKIGLRPRKKRVEAQPASALFLCRAMQSPNEARNFRLPAFP
jgi:pilus assembly protein Flp/PilA